jgi:uncharacterized membrane protein YphA (DoxX/SURF4 family)
MKTTQLDKALAHGLARLGLGVNIALHGFVRLPNLSGFATDMQKQFAETFLSGPLVYATGYCLVIGEAVVGTLLVVGFWLRPALVAGSLLMILLLSGTLSLTELVRRRPAARLSGFLRRTVGHRGLRSLLHRPCPAERSQ